MFITNFTNDLLDEFLIILSEKIELQWRNYQVKYENERRAISIGVHSDGVIETMVHVLQRQKLFGDLGEYADYIIELLRGRTEERIGTVERQLNIVQSRIDELISHLCNKTGKRWEIWDDCVMLTVSIDGVQHSVSHSVRPEDTRNGVAEYADYIIEKTAIMVGRFAVGSDRQ